MGRLSLKSYAKINLYLAVVNKRRDNYHNIRTLFERVSLSDRIILSGRRDGLIKISCSNPDVPRDSSNLCFQAAQLLRKKFNLRKGLDIRIAKRIPVGAGLGGGSGNAAAVLCGLNRLWKLNLSREGLACLGKKIGCDVPFFIYNTPFAWGLERGDKIKPLNQLKKTRLWHILVAPRFKVSTPLIYARWDKLKRRKTPCKCYGLRLTTSRFDVKMLTSLLYNDLEEISGRIYPEINRIKEKLVSLGAKAVLMSGSGPAVAAVVSSRKQALSLRKKINNCHRPWRVWAARTV